MPLYKNLHKFLCVRYHKILCMGWLQLVGSLKLQVYLAEYRLLYWSLLQKRPIILRSAGPSLIIYPLDTMPLHKNLHKFLCVRYHKNLFMGWLQLVGSLKLQVYFAEYRLFYRSLLQKRPIILRSAGSSLIIYPLDTIDIIQKSTQNFVCKISQKNLYGVATISRLLKIRSLFCRIPSLL